MKYFGPILSALAFWACLSAPAQAITVTIVRVSDTVGIITGTGSLPTTGPSSAAHVLAFGTASQGVFGTQPPSTAFFPANPISGALSIGVPIGYSSTYIGSPGSIFYLGNLAGSALSGSIAGELEVTLSVGTWASVGTSGDLFWGASWASTPVDAGTWSIVAPVPVPASLTLMIAALGGVSVLGMRRRAAAV